MKTYAFCRHDWSNIDHLGTITRSYPCGTPEAGDRLCPDCFAWRERSTLRDLWVALHMWGDVSGATDIAQGIIRAMSGSNDNGCTYLWNQAMNYVHGPTCGIHPSHPADYRERVMDEWRENAMRKVARAVL
jgi:hypothetical protein